MVINVFRVGRHRREAPVNLIRLQRHQRPAPPYHELCQNVFDSGRWFLGDVANLYVDDGRELRFVDVVTSGFMGLGKKHHLVPVESITDEGVGQITLGVDQQTVERGPPFSNPKAAPDDALQRSVREHYGLS